MRISDVTKTIYNTIIPKEVAAKVQGKALSTEFIINKNGKIIPTKGIKGRGMYWLGESRCDPKMLGKLLLSTLGADHPNTLYLEEHGHAILDQDKEQIRNAVRQAFDSAPLD